jgi:hypothetical protein
MDLKTYFRRAYQDPAFRNEKLKDLRQFKSVNLTLFGFSTALGIVVTLYCGFTDGEWFLGIERSLPLIILTGMGFALKVSQVAALEAMEPEEPKPEDPPPGNG